MALQISASPKLQNSRPEVRVSSLTVSLEGRGMFSFESRDLRGILSDLRDRIRIVLQTATAEEKSGKWQLSVSGPRMSVDFKNLLLTDLDDCVSHLIADITSPVPAP